MDIRVRPATPEDAPLIAWTMLMAGRSHLQRGIWDIIISQPEEKCLELLQYLTLTGPRHMCSYSEFLVADVDGRPAAALSGYDPQTNGELTVTEPLAEAAAKAGLTEADMAAGNDGLVKFLTCHPDEEPGAWIVEHVATRPEFRRSGAISKLLTEVLDRGRQSGFRLAQVSFYINNVPAEKAYYKAGFQYKDEKRHPDFEELIGSPGMVRLLRTL